MNVFFWFAISPDFVYYHPRFWEYFEIDGILTNAYDIFCSPKIRREIAEKGIHRFFQF